MKQDTKPKTRIIVPHGGIEKLSQEMGVARNTAKTYLDGVTNSPRQAQARLYALNELEGVYAR